MIPYIETHITDACNLKCRGCSHFSPLAEPHNKDLGEFRREFERLAEIEDVWTIRLMGGEPLLNPDFMEYCRIARSLFPRSKIALVTNGLLGSRLQPYTGELHELGINVTMSDYHLAEQYTPVLTERHDKGSLYNVSLDPTGSKDRDAMFRRCDIKAMGCTFLRDGRIYLCSVAGTIRTFWDYFGIDYWVNQDDTSIDIFTHTAEEIEDFISQPCELCRFCDIDRRINSFQPWERSRKEITEWT